MSVILIGLPGSGKSTVARHLARMVQWRCIDTDTLIERDAGQSIAALFEAHGEAHFRTLEHTAVKQASGTPQAVVATGGGAVLRADNRSAMRQEGNFVIYIHHRPDALARQQVSTLHRPLLRDADPVQRYRELYRQRDALYRQTAHHVYDAGRRGGISSAVRMIAMQLELAGVFPQLS